MSNVEGCVENLYILCHISKLAFGNIDGKFKIEMEETKNEAGRR